MNEDFTSIVNRVERYFKISSLLCSSCGELGHICNSQIDIVEKPEDYGIYTKEDWEKEMDKEMNWIIENRKAVLLCLTKLKKEWPESCKSLRYVLSLQKRNYNWRN